MVATFAIGWQARAATVGFGSAQTVDPDGETIKIGVWYPTRGHAEDSDIGPFTQTVATNAPIVGRRLPLVVMSHGTGGALEGHYDTALALARAGFVVAAVLHPHDNYIDSSRTTHLEDRPKVIRNAVDFMLRDWNGHSSIDPNRVGLFGFSSGAFTVLISAGAIPDLARIAPYCNNHAQAFVCQLLKQHPTPQAAPLPPEAWVSDPRVKAVVAAAPAIGFTFTPSGLAKVRVPVQLWQAADDHILPAPDYVEPVRDGLPRRPDYHLVPDADHFDFLAPCSDVLARAVPSICTEHDDFDRARFHRHFNAAVVAFFRRSLR